MIYQRKEKSYLKLKKILLRRFNCCTPKFSLISSLQSIMHFYLGHRYATVYVQLEIIVAFLAELKTEQLCNGKKTCNQQHEWILLNPVAQLLTSQKHVAVPSEYVLPIGYLL